MKDFESFKESRSKTDPSARGLSEHQWQQAYEAYRSVRKQVGRNRKAHGEGGRSRKSRRSRRGGQESGRGFVNPRQILIEQSRANSAYSELRMLVDTLAWVATGLILLGLVLKFYFFTAVLGLLASLIGAFLQLIAVVALRKLFHVLLDVADLEIERKQREIGGNPEPGPEASKSDELDLQ